MSQTDLLTGETNGDILLSDLVLEQFVKAFLFALVEEQSFSIKKE